MPNVIATPRNLRNGEVITEFTDTTSTTAVTYTYPLQQAGISIENNGLADIFVTVGTYTNQVVSPKKTWKADTVFTSFSIRSNANSQEFTAAAFQNDTEGSGEADSGMISTINAQLNRRGLDVTDRRWGAKGDGVADDTAAIQAAVTYATTYKRTLYFPSGQYKITGSGFTINANIAIKGQGFQSKIIFIPTVADSILFTFTNAGAGAGSLTDEGQLNCPIVSDIKIDSDRSVRAHAFKFVHCDNVNIQNVFVRGIKGSSLILEKSREGSFIGFRTRFNGDDGNHVPDVQLTSIDPSGDNGNFNRFVNCFFIFAFWDLVSCDKNSNTYFESCMFHRMTTSGKDGSGNWIPHAGLQTIVGDLFGNTPNQYANLITNYSTNFKNAINLRLSNSSNVNIDAGSVFYEGGDYNVQADNSELNIGDVFINGSQVACINAINNSNVFLSLVKFDNTQQLFTYDGTSTISGEIRTGVAIGAVQAQTGNFTRKYYGSMEMYKILELKGAGAYLKHNSERIESIGMYNTQTAVPLIFRSAVTTGTSMLIRTVFPDGTDKDTLEFNISGNNTRMKAKSGSVYSLGARPLNESFQVADLWFQNDTLRVFTSQSDLVVPSVLKIAGAPGVVPKYEGQIYVDTTNKKVYIATGATVVGDWALLN